MCSYYYPYLSTLLSWSQDLRAICGSLMGFAIGTFAFYGIGYPLGVLLSRCTTPSSSGAGDGGSHAVINILMCCGHCGSCWRLLQNDALRRGAMAAAGGVASAGPSAAHIGGASGSIGGRGSISVMVGEVPPPALPPGREILPLPQQQPVRALVRTSSRVLLAAASLPVQQSEGRSLSLGRTVSLGPIRPGPLPASTGLDLWTLAA